MMFHKKISHYDKIRPGVNHQEIELSNNHPNNSDHGNFTEMGF